jgi:hypothetical protein
VLSAGYRVVLNAVSDNMLACVFGLKDKRAVDRPAYVVKLSHPTVKL